VVTIPSGSPFAAPVNLRALGALELRDARADEPRILLVQPKRLALLAYMTLAGPGTHHQREKLCGMFWPDADEERARLSLRQAVHLLRRATGTDLITNRLGDEIGVRSEAVRCDVTEFERAIAERRPADAIALYRGNLLQDFHVTGVAPEFEWWVDGQRARLHGLALTAARELTERAEAEGDLQGAIRCARELTRLAPFDEPGFRHLVSLLDQAGDRAGALKEYESFHAALARELETEPSAETRTLIARLRAGNGSPAEPPVPPLPPSAVIEPVALPRARRTPIRAFAVLGVAALTLTGLAMLRARAPAPRIVLAVGEIHSQARDTLLAPGLIRELLASDLARIEGIDVVSGERMQELLTQLGPSRDSAGTIARAARRAGATQVLEGILSGGAGSPLRIDVRRADLAGGKIRGALVVEAADIFSLADQLSGQVARDLGHAFPRRPLAETRSQSLVAGRLYEAGARAFYQGDAAAAVRLFDAALREDSTFTMAALFASRASWGVRGDSMALRYLGLAHRAAQRASERERLLVESEWASRTNSPNAVALAESLVTRYPSEPAGEFSLGDALVWIGERERAIPHLRLAIEQDSTGLAAAPGGNGEHTWCRACDAFTTLVNAQLESDSVAAAERTAREWIRRRPGDWRPWTELSNVLELAGRLGDARDAQRESARLLGHDATDAIFRARLALESGDFRAADRLLDDQVASSDPNLRTDARWWRVISLRQQGRLREALHAADAMIREDEASPGPHDGGSLGRIARAQTTFELGRFREAGTTFETIAAAPIVGDSTPLMPGRSARRGAWMLTHAATAYAAAGDTGRLARLADAVEQLGARSANGRDRRLHHYVRALLLEARGDWARAESELRLAVSSPNLGFTRINLELARTLLALSRPRDAIPVLQAALRGGLEGSNFYVMRAELHEALGRAFAAAGERDSARVHNAAVVATWSAGDLDFQARTSRLLRVAPGSSR
jgi:DNA-binding SARP family transcriptional activator/tetratricopeptide (TPR) repeat protein